MYVNHEFTIAVITVIFALYRDFRQLPWFFVTAVIITKIGAISISKRSIYLNICSAFLSWARIVASLTLLNCWEYMHTERWHHGVQGVARCTLHSALSYVKQIALAYTLYGRWHRRMWPEACSSASYRAGKIIHSVSQSIIMYLQVLFKLIILHGHVPTSFGIGVTIPLVKDKTGNFNDVNNYRGITLSPVISSCLR